MTVREYDVVIVGAGISGAIIAKTLSWAGYKVLIIEAGLDAGMALDGQAAYEAYQGYLRRYYQAQAKVPNAAYPNLPTAPSPDVLDMVQIKGSPSDKGYFVQNGPFSFGSDYLRAPGGTTLHWMGTCLRMLPNDFRLKTEYGVGVDWPFSYEDLKPYYEIAEFEIGVSANVNELFAPNTGRDFFGEDYIFPMQGIPQSYLDKQFKDCVEDLVITEGNELIQLKVTPTPQGRNSTTNLEYRWSGPFWDPRRKKLALSRSDKSYVPFGSLWDPYTGQRCEGNSSCVPICPVQAKYNALKTLKSSNPDCRPTVITQAVAYQVETDFGTGNVTGIRYKHYRDPNSSDYTVGVARGKRYVLAAHTVENAKLLLASGIANSSDQVGRNLMDHVTLLAWGLMPNPVYGFRGPGSSSHIPVFRDGNFRREHSAFMLPINNWGWGWPTGAPDTDVDYAVNSLRLFGRELRDYFEKQMTRQVLLDFECEQMPEPANRVTIDPKYLDLLGNYRPVIDYDLSDYMRKSLVAARNISRQIFSHIGIEDYTKYRTDEPNYFVYDNVGYSFQGAGHLVGTHRMGSSAKESVVDLEQRTWDHPNLFLVGCGNMPTLGTSNPTLTMAALTFWAAENILKDLSQ